MQLPEIHHAGAATANQSCPGSNGPSTGPPTHPTCSISAQFSKGLWWTAAQGHRQTTERHSVSSPRASELGNMLKDVTQGRNETPGP